MKNLRIFFLVIIACFTIIYSLDAKARAIDSTIHAFGAYSGIIRSPTIALGRTYRSGFGGGVEYMMNVHEPQSWFGKRARLGVSVTDYWFYHFRKPFPESVNLLLFTLSGHLSIVDLDKKAIPYVGLNVGGGLMIGNAKNVNGGILDKGAVFDINGMFGFDYRFTKHISIITRVGGGIDIAKGPPEDRIGKSFTTYPRFFTTFGMGYTF